MRNITQLDPNKIKNDYPKGYSAFISWLSSIRNPDEIELLVSIQTEIANLTFIGNARVLYDFFDDREIYVTVKPDDSNDAVNGFIYYTSESTHSSVASNRNEAEQKVFIEAFEQLEKQLK